MTLLGPGDEILVPDPIYDAYQSPIRLTGRHFGPPEKQASGGPFFTLDFEALTKGLYPGHPSSSPEHTMRIRRHCLHQDGNRKTGRDHCARKSLLISDEIYEAITYEDHKHISSGIDLTRDARAPVVVNSFSKTYAMTGWRLGYCAARAELIRSMLLVLQQSSRGPATFIQDAGAAAPHRSTGLRRKRCDETYAPCVDRLQRLLPSAGFKNIDVLAPEGGFFAMLDITRTGLSSDEARRRLLPRPRCSGDAWRGLRPRWRRYATGLVRKRRRHLSRGLELLRKGLESL